MTILNEAVRLFFAISALILVGMLSTPMGGEIGKSSEGRREIASVTHGAPSSTQKAVKKTSSSNKRDSRSNQKLARTVKLARRG